MNEHPDIEELTAIELTSEVAAHLQSCNVCAQIHADVKLLEMDFKDLVQNANIPESVDEKIGQDISDRSTQIRKSLFRKNLITSLSAVAAVLILSFTLFTNINTVKNQLADINGDGEVNVIDSMLLAQNIELPDPDRKYDLNGDGAVNEKDLQMLRNAVVSLDGRLP